MIKVFRCSLVLTTSTHLHGVYFSTREDVTEKDLINVFFFNQIFAKETHTKVLEVKSVIEITVFYNGLEEMLK